MHYYLFLSVVVVFRIKLLKIVNKKLKINWSKEIKNSIESPRKAIAINKSDTTMIRTLLVKILEEGNPTGMNNTLNER